MKTVIVLDRGCLEVWGICKAKEFKIQMEGLRGVDL